jgi:hypothetical protein
MALPEQSSRHFTRLALMIIGLAGVAGCGGPETGPEPSSEAEAALTDPAAGEERLDEGAAASLLGGEDVDAVTGVDSEPSAEVSAAAPKRSDACASWGCGSVTVTFVNGNTIRPFRESVRDTKCDGYTVAITFQMQYVDGKTYVTPWFTAGTCHDDYRVKNSYWIAGKNIVSGRAVIWLQGRRKFAYGSWVTNPYL